MFGSRKAAAGGGGGGAAAAAAADGGETIIIPRNFKLLEELEKFEKGAGNMHLSAGLVDPEDIFLSEWNCSILGPDGTTFAQRFYELRVSCSDTYPTNPPTIRFNTMVNMSNVDGSGLVDLARSPSLRRKGGWTRELGIEEALSAIREDMSDSSNKRLNQPPEGQNYS